MVMQTLQIRLGEQLLKKIDVLVHQGLYNSRSDAIRDAVRNSFWKNQVGTIPYTGNSIDLVRNARKKLSKQKIYLQEINSL